MNEQEKGTPLNLQGLTNTEIALIYDVMKDFFESSLRSIKEANISRKKNCLMVQMMLASAESKVDELSDESKRLLEQLKEDTIKVFGYELEIPKHHVHYNTVKSILDKMEGLAEDIYEAEPEIKTYVEKKTIDDHPEDVKALEDLLTQLRESLDKDKER